MGSKEINREPQPPKDLWPTLTEALSRIDLTEAWKNGLASLETQGRPYYGYGTRVDDDYGPNRSPGYALGRYQMRKPGLRDAGMLDGERWTGKYGINSEEEFMNNPAVQEAALKDLTVKIEEYIKKGGLDKKVGKAIESDQGKLDLSYSKLVAAIHNQGIGATRDYLRWVEDNGWDSRGKINSIENGARRNAFNGIEERLRKFPDVPYKE
ncbi:MAG TPA: hypothetical protein VFS04_00690 [Alphaproteobacteria bacterium]|nr:hypothetical protein [Alphaproteobacteria bacterium]